MEGEEIELSMARIGEAFRFKDDSHIYWRGAQVEGRFILVYSYEKHLNMRKCGTHYPGNIGITIVDIKKERGL